MDDTDEDNISLGDYLRIAREEKGLSIRALARRVGVDHTYLARVENGERGDPKPELLNRLAAELNVDPAELLAYVGVEPALPEPRLYFRRKLGVDADEAEVLARLVEEHQAKKRREGHHEDTNQE